uniref:Uncharacterized protein n=1 Tax=Hyaloperonospora arabidopsidis (strain Emoy2) TaxID=559515 RepID=M4BXJ2_HYAAE
MISRYAANSCAAPPFKDEGLVKTRTRGALQLVRQTLDSTYASSQMFSQLYVGLSFSRDTCINLSASIWFYAFSVLNHLL